MTSTSVQHAAEGRAAGRWARAVTRLSVLRRRTRPAAAMPGHEIDPRFPHRIRAVLDADGTPCLHVATSPSTHRDRTGRSWLHLAVNATTVENDDEFYPMPRVALRRNRVKVPVEAWIDQRTAGIAPQELTAQATPYMTLGGWQDNDRGAQRLAEWACGFSAVHTLCSAHAERVFLDEEITVILFRHPQHGPIAAVLYLDSGEEADTFDLQLWHNTATAAQWGHWADFDLTCTQGHRWRYRDNQVTGPDGAVHAHRDLWRDTPGVRHRGNPAIFTSVKPGLSARVVPCPRCGAECTPRLAALRD